MKALRRVPYRHAAFTTGHFRFYKYQLSVVMDQTVRYLLQRLACETQL